MNTNELNCETIEHFWNKFKADRKEASMFFKMVENLDDNGSYDDEKEMNLNCKQEYYLIVKFGSKTLEWSPNTLTNIEWTEQFSKLKKDVCSYFHLENNGELEFKWNELDMNVNDADEIEMLWEEEVEINDNKCTSLEVINGVEMKKTQKNQNDEEKENVCKMITKNFYLLAICLFQYC